jgi:glycine cleavage system H protein
MNTPQDLQYSRSDEWVRAADGAATVGITDYAQHELGDIVYVELPEAGTRVKAGATFGVVESVKAVSDLVSPVSGEVLESNTPATDDPSLINNSPYGDGWLIKVKLDGESEELLSAADYETFRS